MTPVDACHALTMPGSNQVTAAELRIDISKSLSEITQCTTPSDALESGTLAHATIGGIDFTTFNAGDAAMSHYLNVRSYRAVHDGICYAIDLLIVGTNPQVYDPPATAPFSQDAAFAQLQNIMRSFRFTH